MLFGISSRITSAKALRNEITEDFLVRLRAAFPEEAGSVRRG